jgi:hypothetical protein
MGNKTIMKGGTNKMFWSKKSAKEEEKLRGPQMIPELVQKHLVAERKMDPDLVKLLKAVVRKSATGEKAFNIRVFDESEGLAKKVQVKDYTSLDECPDLIIYEGWFDEGSKQVKLEEKKKVSWDTTIFTQAEIQQKIETLKEPGSRSSFTWLAVRHMEAPSAWVLLLLSLIPTIQARSRRGTSYT